MSRTLINTYLGANIEKYRILLKFKPKIIANMQLNYIFATEIVRIIYGELDDTRRKWSRKGCRKGA